MASQPNTPENMPVEVVDQHPKLCSRCKKNPVAFPESTNPWCAECRADGQKKYLESKEGMAEGKGFAEGARLMKEQLAAQFECQRSGMFTGYEICDLIREALPPQRLD